MIYVKVYPHIKGDYMFFKNRMELLNFLRTCQMIGYGSQGTCYLNSTKNIVYKVFNQYLDEEDNEYYIDYSKENIMRFSKIKNDTFIWADDLIYVNNEIVGYISNYVSAKSLYKINPLNVNLNELIDKLQIVKNDIKIISNHGVLLYDIVYNILYGENIYSIDFDEYAYSDMDNSKIIIENNKRFDYEIYMFLIENYFNEFILSNNMLNRIYEAKELDVIEFIKLLKNELSGLLGHDIEYLNSAKSYLNKNKVKTIYQRNFF